MRATIPSVLVAVVMAALALPAAAWGDGDPASDVLLGENVFYPFMPAVSASLQSRLNAEIAAAGRAHLPLKIALIASPVDLGAIPELFGKPQQYADFLDQEISLGGGKQPLLVVMREGLGVSGLDRAATAAAATLHKPLGAASDDLARAAILAVPKLAAAAGHPIAGASTAPASGGSSNVLALTELAAVAIIAAGGILAVRSRRARVDRAGSDRRGRHGVRGRGSAHRRGAPRG